LVIEGPPGIGKSRLLTEVMALADKSGVRTLFGEAFQYQQTVPFFALFMATLRADPPVGDADALRRLGGSADLRYWVVQDLADAIDAAAAQTPLAIVLEDIHWADNGTLLALRSLAIARRDVAVLWVLTARTGAGGPAVQETLSVLQRADEYSPGSRRSRQSLGFPGMLILIIACNDNISLEIVWRAISMAFSVCARRAMVFARTLSSERNCSLQ